MALPAFGLNLLPEACRLPLFHAALLLSLGPESLLQGLSAVARRPLESECKFSGREVTRLRRGRGARPPRAAAPGMIDLVLIQFALSAVAFLLRFSEDCCASWAFRCRACLSCCCRCAAPPRKGQREERLLCRVLSWLMPRWYWVYLSGQAGLLLREAFVINTMVLDPHRPETGWCWEVIVSNAASWIVLLANWAEVRRFALVRNMDVPHKPIDQVMDMLLLPSNYCFFCNLIVRLIRLQSGSRFSHEDTQSLAHTVIASAELWEAWALWSVLELFVTVVNSNVRRTVTVERSHDAHYLDTISGYQRLSIQGVQVWVLMLSGAITSEVVVKGVVALYMPTLCHQGLSIFEGTGCESCAEWYDKNIGTASMCVIYLLCSFAIAFVMYFEDAFKHGCGSARYPAVLEVLGCQECGIHNIFPVARSDIRAGL
ncbi:unnamed protein product [Prorocentrum cordatum]|uniref:Protein RFT1 homolog n=1 Tax=Prorocentrum cordatum TaxID=2364126 RepID=A0ABN9SK75_9DINO|nr:unnamed protein product [Polarella glacialis]